MSGPDEHEDLPAVDHTTMGEGSTHHELVGSFDLDGVSITAFGSSRHSPIAAAALLRATAAAAGARLHDASTVDLVAATIAAECWMSALNAKNLTQPVRHGTAAVAALAALLARAAGIAEVQDCPALAGAEQDVKMIHQVENLAKWATTVVGVDASEVLRRAAADLSAGSNDSRLEAMAGLLVIVADNQDRPN
jgi:hypothetical protein